MYIIEGAFYLWKWYWDLQYCLFVCSSAYGTGGLGWLLSAASALCCILCISLQTGHTTHRRHAHYPGSCNLRGVFADFRRSHGHAEVCGKFLRNNPKHITILAPVTTWFLTVLCGTGHVVYTMFPIIYDISIKQNIRPERPMAVSSVASQMGVSASPVSVAVVSIVGFMAAAGQNYSLLQILSISVPATLLVFSARLFTVTDAAEIWKKTKHSRK